MLRVLLNKNITSIIIQYKWEQRSYLFLDSRMSLIVLMENLDMKVKVTNVVETLVLIIIYCTYEKRKLLKFCFFIVRYITDGKIKISPNRDI